MGLFTYLTQFIIVGAWTTVLLNFCTLNKCVHLSSRQISYKTPTRWNFYFIFENSVVTSTATQQRRSKIYKIRFCISVCEHRSYQDCLKSKRYDKGRQVVQCTVSPNILVPSVWHRLRVTFLAPRILRWLPVFFGKFLHPCFMRPMSD